MLEQLPTHLRDFVEREIAAGHYASETEVIEDALSLLADEADRMTVGEAVAEALAQIERGEGIEYTDDFWERTAQRVRAKSHRGHVVRDDVKY
jgi:Arc/MetJ-type ribon-helix-helix transcriptional regulator